MKAIAQQFNQLNQRLMSGSTTYAVVYKRFKDYINASSFLGGCKYRADDINMDEPCLIIITTHGEDVVIKRTQVTSLDDVLNRADSIPDVSALSYELEYDDEQIHA